MDKYPENVNPERCVVLIGSPVDGFEIFGPFDTPADATDYGDTLLPKVDWWVHTLHTVQCDENGKWIDE